MKTQKPNVVVFFTDQQRWDTTGVHGNPLQLTPNFDRVAQAGTHVKHSFSCQPVCGPARSCLQTGMYATQTGCFKNGVALPEDAQTLGHSFRDAGYETGYIGKWHLAADEHAPVPAAGRGGYEYWLASNILEFTSDAYQTTVYDNDDQPIHLPGYRVDALTDAAIRYIDSNKDNPFFLFLSLVEPHQQNRRDDYPPPDVYQNRYGSTWMPTDLAALEGNAHRQMGGYLGMVKRIDEAFGRLLDALKSLSLTDNTIVLFTADHGNHFMTRNDEYKRSIHESSIRVPTAFQGPGFDGGGQVQQLFSLIDIPPTLLDAAGLPVPDQMQGCSLLPLLRQEPVEWPDDLFVQVSEAEVGRGIRTQRWKYGVVAQGLDGYEVSGSDTYTETYLYDLLADPYELNNLAGLETHREVSNILRHRLLDRMTAAGETAPTIEDAPVRPGNPQVSVTEAEANA
jgi:arylsulfatase A-like enzyme